VRTEHVDLCVIGSGAGGSVLAYEAARKDLRTLVVERGPYLRTSDMTTSEVDMIPRLYKDGGMQMNTAVDFFILQGSCVGGSTTVSNMVLIRAADEAFARWAQLGAALPTDELHDCYARIESTLEAGVAAPSSASRSTQLFEIGARALGFVPQPMLKALGACRACGHCNVGCSFGTKRSALTTFIPWAESHGARVLADTTVTELHRQRGKIDYVEAVSGPRAETVRIHARAFALCAGAIGSSALLLASGIKRNVGTRLSFNAGAMMVADFDEALDAYDADQMTSYVMGDDYLIEATHNPLMSAALTTPGWMEDHAALMSRSRHLAYAGAMVGTEPTGRVVMSPWFGHEETRFCATAGDMTRLREGLSAIARIFFAAGARRVFLPTERFTPLGSARDVHVIHERIRTMRDLQCGSSHPQGGNPMSNDRALGVVDTDFAVHDLDNAFVCDASVFPDAIGVNPMNTIMALALHAAPKILARA
jgi:choline dehydrogenase-like flavoprotein